MSYKIWESFEEANDNYSSYLNINKILYFHVKLISVDGNLYLRDIKNIDAKILQEEEHHFADCIVGYCYIVSFENGTILNVEYCTTTKSLQ